MIHLSLSGWLKICQMKMDVIPDLRTLYVHNYYTYRWTDILQNS